MTSLLLSSLALVSSRLGRSYGLCVRLVVLCALCLLCVWFLVVAFCLTVWSLAVVSSVVLVRVRCCVGFVCEECVYAFVCGVTVSVLL